AGDSFRGIRPARPRLPQSCPAPTATRLGRPGPPARHFAALDRATHGKRWPLAQSLGRDGSLPPIWRDVRHIGARLCPLRLVFATTSRLAANAGGLRLVSLARVALSLSSRGLRVAAPKPDG